MAGKANATLVAAGTRGLLLAVLAGGLAFATAYLRVDDPCSAKQAEALAVALDESRARAPKATAEARKKAKAVRARCDERVDKQQREAVISGLVTFGAALGVRGLGEGFYDRNRQRRNDVRPGDVQPGGPDQRARRRARRRRRRNRDRQKTQTKSTRH